jgi:Rod binding domain-containing protein
MPLEQLAKDPTVSEKEKVKVVSQQFESFLLRSFLTEARKPMFPGGALAGSASQQMYHDTVTSQLADTISRSGSFGLGTMLQAQMERQLHTDPVEAKAVPTETPK